MQLIDSITMFFLLVQGLLIKGFTLDIVNLSNDEFCIHQIFILIHHSNKL